MSIRDEGTDLAPAGKVWVCIACGKTSRSRFGFDKDNKNCCDPGWDVSCALNARLYDESQLERGPSGRVVKVGDIPYEHNREEE